MTPSLSPQLLKALRPFVAAAALAAGLHVLVVAPRARYARELGRRAETLAAEQAAMSQGTVKLTQWLHGQARGHGDDAAVDSLTPDLAVPEVLQRLSNLGEAHGIRITAIRPEAPGAPVTVSPGDGTNRVYAPIPLHLTATGSYRNVGEFIEDFRRTGGLASVRDLHLTLDREHHALAIEMTVDVFGRIS